MIELVAVQHTYSDARALHEVTLTTRARRVGLVGVNGAGKSTLLSVLAGSLRPTAGSVRLNGLDPYDSNDRRRALLQTAFMPQSLDVARRMRVHEFVSYVGWLRGLSWSTARDAATDAIRAVNLIDRSTSTMGSLSGGMTRRVALAQALVARPRLLLLDEPTTGLDPEQREVMVELLRALPADVQVVMSSHVMEDLEDAVDELVILDDGEIAFHDSKVALRQLAPPGTARPLQAAFLSVVTSHRKA
ncbi:ABC transporter ATP-binding protein [Cellulomonas alba]|uniref:ATP-binding cassette domain-containing protein n=1 Tax=Cellulomonas alba TaxID=3053467 RepID=A0ABT7SL35_9CELL|nr:ATP-binding cassette domain-containing protein [Cellulomonas alba]MDM7856244.1 ATP-binding cassette domain-containing protein [Cellulomonas alba]